MSTLEELKRAEEERRQAERQGKKTGLYNAVKMGNQARSDVGQLGNQLSQYGQQYNNQGLQNVGNKLYKWSGEKYMDNALSKIGDKVGKIWGSGVDDGLNHLTNITNKVGNPIQSGMNMWDSGLDKLSQETGSQLSQTGGSAISDAIGNEVAGNTANVGGSALSDALATETGGSALQAGAQTGLQTGAQTGGSALSGALAAETGGTALAGGTTGLAAGAGTAATGAATGAASAGMAAVPIIGWAALAAKTAYDMWSAHKKKQQGAAMQADALADKEMEQDQNKAFAQQAQDEQQMQKFTNMVNEQLGQGGTDNPYEQYIKQQQEQQPKVDLDEWQGDDGLSTDEVSAAPAQPQQSTGQEVASDAANVVGDIFSKYQGGESGNTIADAVQNEVSAPDTKYQGAMNDYLKENPQTKDTPIDFNPEDTQYYKPSPHSNAVIDTRTGEVVGMYDNWGVAPQQSQQPQDYQTGELLNKAQLPDLKQQIYNQMTTGETGVQNYNKPELMEQPQMSESKRGTMDDILRGFNENATHKMGDKRDLIPENERNWKTRFGEGLGTLNRFAQNPLVQAAAVGGIDYLMNRGSRYAGSHALNAAFDQFQNKSKTNSYRDLLQQGDNPTYYNPGIFGQMSSDDYKTIIEKPYKDSEMEKRKAETYKLQIENKQLEKQVKNNPKLNDIIADIATNPRHSQKIIDDYINGGGTLTDEEMEVISAYISSPELLKSYSDANKNTNAFNKNRLEEKKHQLRQDAFDKYGNVNGKQPDRSYRPWGGRGGNGGSSNSGSIVPLNKNGKHPDQYSRFNGKTGIWDEEQGAYGWYDTPQEISQARERNRAHKKVLRERAEAEEKYQTKIDTNEYYDDDKYKSKRPKSAKQAVKTGRYN